jgi:organic radical activating enzyme
MSPTTIDTDRFSVQLREKSIDLAGGRLLMTKFEGTEQEQDLTEPANCDGFGRIRRFRRGDGRTWPTNALPIDPVCKALGLPRTDIIRTQAFQNAACNWRCWYCFVPFSLLAADPRHASWTTADALVDLYASQEDRPVMIDLTGGQPDLVPEWVPWTMRALRDRGLDRQVYLWSDDNLSNDYFWRFLTEEDREVIAGYANYGRVCCFKGFNDFSFSFNTRAAPELFDRQFELMGRLLAAGIDIYAYATFTTPLCENIADDMARFVDRLQALDPYLPLRTVPLEIRTYTPVQSRLKPVHEHAMANQYVAIDAWTNELSARFSFAERLANIADVPLAARRIP